MNPMLPHLTEEIWERLGQKETLADMPWPEADPEYLLDETVTIAVQVNGKLRGTIDLIKDCDPKVAEDKALKVEGVIAAMGDKKPSRIIVVPNRIINVVV